MRSGKHYTNKVRSLTKRNHKKRAKQILELKNTVSEMKNSINIRMDEAEERICDLEDRNFEFIHSEENKNGRMK